MLSWQGLGTFWQPGSRSLPAAPRLLLVRPPLLLRGRTNGERARGRGLLPFPGSVAAAARLCRVFGFCFFCCCCSVLFSDEGPGQSWGRRLSRTHTSCASPEAGRLRSCTCQTSSPLPARLGPAGFAQPEGTGRGARAALLGFLLPAPCVRFRF